MKTCRAGDARGQGLGIVHPGDKWAAQRWSSRIATGRKLSILTSAEEHPHYPEGEGLITRGTFGPILSIVIVDAAGITLRKGPNHHAHAG
ncbi:MAG TPA: hypothetical protein VK638_58445 [Edaphobacter sp.]|nr:hypothetical protein [Edaphobacter sp.]